MCEKVLCGLKCTLTNAPIFISSTEATIGISGIFFSLNLFTYTHSKYILFSCEIFKNNEQYYKIEKQKPVATHKVLYVCEIIVTWE